MNQTQPLVSIHLLTFNGRKYIRPCLNSALNQIYPKIEILITDNASSDGTAEYLRKNCPKHGIEVVYNKKNVGFAKGQNQGIKRTKGDYVLCLNQDLILDKYFIAKTMEVFKKNPQAASIQGRLLRWSGKMNYYNDLADYNVCYITDSKGFKIFKNGRIINRGQGQIDDNQDQSIEPIFGTDGAAPVYNKKALEDVRISFSQNNKLIDEYFDEDFFAYKEDVDLAWRFRLYGWESYYQPAALAWHDRTAGESAETNYWKIIQERRKISKFSKCLAFKNQRLMHIKNELIWHLVKRLPKIAIKEIGSWLYIIVFETYTLKALKELFSQMPDAWRKRKIIMTNKKAGVKEIEKWFN